MSVSPESWAVLALVLGAFGVTVVRVAVKVLRNARAAQLAEQARRRDEFRELRAQNTDPSAAGTHIIEGELAPIDRDELVRELREAGWVDAPYLDVSGGRVREVLAAELGYVDADDRPVGGVVRSEPITTPRQEWRELAEWPPPAHTRYVRGEFATPVSDMTVARVGDVPRLLYAHDAARVLGVEGAVGVHVGFRWVNGADRWEVCLLDREGDRVGEWVPVPVRDVDHTD